MSLAPADANPGYVHGTTSRGLSFFFGGVVWWGSTKGTTYSIKWDQLAWASSESVGEEAESIIPIVDYEIVLTRRFMGLSISNLTDGCENWWSCSYTTRRWWTFSMATFVILYVYATRRWQQPSVDGNATAGVRILNNDRMNFRAVVDLYLTRWCYGWDGQISWVRSSESNQFWIYDNDYIWWDCIIGTSS